ncbi:unnamed protein product [Rhodiola kirilowii]
MVALNLQQNAFSATDEMGSPMFFSDSNGLVVRPIPRRPGISKNDLIMSPRGQMRNPDQCENNSVAELLDSLLRRKLQSSSSQSPPYFYTGSPPVRVTNPLIQDNRFSNDEPVSLSDLSSPPASVKSSPSSSVQKGSCGRMNSVSNPAPIRVVGFRCGSQNSGITAVS